jgi:PD-(D/E)XK endonuclease
MAIMAALQAQGYAILVPFGENTRYDLVIDNGACLSRVQCKTGRLRNGSVRFNTCSSYSHHQNPAVEKRTYEGEIDEFAVFCPDTCGVYLLPIEDVRATRVATLRVDPARNHQRKGVRLAAAYEIARVEID